MAEDKDETQKWIHLYPLMRVIIRQIVDSPKPVFDGGIRLHNSALSLELYKLSQPAFDPIQIEPKFLKKKKEEETQAVADLRRYAESRRIDTSTDIWMIVATLAAATEFLDYEMDRKIKRPGSGTQKRPAGIEFLDLMHFMQNVTHLWSFLEVSTGKKLHQADVAREMARREIAKKEGHDLENFKLDQTNEKHFKALKAREREISDKKNKFIRQRDAGVVKELNVEFRKKLDFHRKRKIPEYDWSCSETEKENLPEWNINFQSIKKIFWNKREKR